jgi:hypothetical protein
MDRNFKLEKTFIDFLRELLVNQDDRIEVTILIKLFAPRKVEKMHLFESLKKSLHTANKFLNSKNLLPSMFIATLFVFSLWSRIPYIQNPFSVNPDEAELIATAKLASQSFFPNQNYVTSSHGPIWPEFLGLLENLGVTLNFSRAHLISYLLLVISFLVLQLRMLQISKKKDFITYFSFFLINATVFLPLSRDYAFLTSETLPLAILSISILIMTFPSFMPKHKGILVGILCALAFLAKYQVAPLIVIVYFIDFLLKKNDDSNPLRKKSILNLEIIGGFLATLMFFIFLIFSGGGLFKFMNDSVKLSFWYSKGNFPSFGGDKNLGGKIESASQLIWSQPSIVAILFLCIIALLRMQSESVLVFFASRFRVQIRTSQVRFFIILLGFATLVPTGNPFPHYLLLLIWALQVSFLVESSQVIIHDKKLNSIDADLSKSATHYILPILFLVSLVMVSNISNVVQEVKSVRANGLPTSADLKTFVSQLNSVGFDQCEERAQVLIWGWSSEYYTYFNWRQPKDISAITATLWLAGFEKEVLGNRLKTAVLDPNTKCVFNAVGPRYFGSIPIEKSLEAAIPYLEPLLKRSYAKTTLPDELGSLWVRIP